MKSMKLKFLLVACSVLVSLSAASSMSYAGTKTGPADSNAPLGYYSVGDLIKTNDFDDGVGDPWKLSTSYPAQADFDIENGKYNIEISQSGKDTFAIMAKHSGITLEAGHTYTVTFDVTSTEDCKVYAELGDVGDPYYEYWNNNWTPFSITKGETKQVTDQFTMNSTKDNCELAFFLGGEYSAATVPYTVSIDNVHVYDEQFKGYPIEASESKNAVKVNQMGYCGRYEKTAIVDSNLTSPIPWRLLDAGDKVVKSGTTTVKGKDNSSGENIHVIDFSDYRIEGTGYKLEIDNSNVDTSLYDSNQSVPFSISGTTLYDQLKYDSLKYFYLNRSGSKITMPYCDNEDFVRNALYQNDRLGIDSDTWYYDKSGANYYLDITGGWLESEKNEKYVSDSSYAAWMLQNKYENSLANNYNNCTSKDDNTLNIPESSNGFPDMLDEARYNTESLLNMQVPDGYQYSGMVHNNVNVSNWMASVTPLDYDSMNRNRKLNSPSTNATLEFAAVEAQGARLWKQYDSEFSEKCLAAAVKAWDAAMAHPDIIAKASYNDSINGEDKNIDDEFYWAACELYVSTGEDKYLDYIKSSKYYLTMPVTIPNADTEVSGSFDAINVQALGTLTLLSSNNKLDAADLDKAKSNVLAAADKILAIQSSQGYGVPLESQFFNDNYGYPYNSNLYITNAAIVLSYANNISRTTDKYLNGAISTLDYLLGKNAENKSYITGYGFNDVKHPYYNINKNSSVPSGYLVTGPDAGMEDTALKNHGYKPGEIVPQKCYIDDSESWATNRVSLTDNASLAWLVNSIDESIEPSPLYRGDVNHDGKVNIKDYILIQKYLLNNDTPIYTSEADLDWDGSVTVTDALLLKKALMA